MPNPYVIQGTLPSTSLWFMVLDLKDAFFFIPLAQQSQFLFAFEWEPPCGPTQQLIWTVLPQRFRDSSHQFGQALSKNLQDL